MIENGFVKQVRNLEVLTTTRTIMKWNNSEEGRDRTDMYERIDGDFIVYINQYNNTLRLVAGDPFFNVLEQMYHEQLKVRHDKGVERVLDILKSKVEEVENLLLGTSGIDSHVVSHILSFIPVE